MPRQVVQDVGLQQLHIPEFSGGINTAKPETDIADNEFVEILNMEYDNDDNLTTRSGTAEFNTGLRQPTRSTSIHYFKDKANSIDFCIFTAAAAIFTTEEDGTSFSNITGALSLPTDTYWQWENFRAGASATVAYGVNGGTISQNPVKVTNGKVASILTDGNRPPGKYIEIWNNRVFIAGMSSAPNQIRGSKLADGDDWTTTGVTGTVTIEIGPGDNDEITGLHAFREKLFIFKRNRIYVLQADRIAFNSTADTATNTDPSTWSVNIFTNNLGCISGHSIQSVLDDVLFLSANGVASLVASEIISDFRAALASRNIIELSKLSDLTADFPSLIVEAANQYWVSLPPAASPTGKYLTYVLDYRRLQEGVVRWVRFDGKVAGSALGWTLINNKKVFLIGTDGPSAGTQDSMMVKYNPKDTALLKDADNQVYSKKLITKAYSMNLPLIRKYFHKWGLALEILSNSVNLSVSYMYDTIAGRTGSFSFVLSTASLGAGVWDVSLWDTGIWGSSTGTDFSIIRQFRTNSSGKRGKNVTLTIENGQIDQGFTLKDIVILFGILTEKRVSDL